MTESRWDRFVSKAIDVFCVIALGSVSLLMLGLLIAGVVKVATVGW